jgi:hypothetical protein
MQSLSKFTVIVVLCAPLAADCCAQTGVVSVPINSDVALSLAVPANSLPKPFASVISEIKAKSHIPILLPSELLQPVGKASHAVLEKASESEYAISLYYELGIGDADFAAGFTAQAHPDYEPQDLGGVREVKLSHNLRGFFRPVSCGGSCAPANIWWKEGQVLYQIQLKLSSTLRADDQQKAITAVANSSIIVGPR